MVRIRVECDKHNRAFKLLDEEFGPALKDGVQYELIVPLMLEGTDDAEEYLFTTASAQIAHA
jgi:hypothetical protein